MTTRLDIARIGTLKDSLDDEVGQEVLVHVTKHKITPGPGAKITFHIVNRKGVDTEQELLDMALESGEILKSGSWFVMPDGSKVQGQEQAKEWIKTKRTV
jgi:recombination protein RecA